MKLVLIWLILASAQIFGQGASDAKKFDEIVDFPNYGCNNCEPNVQDRVKRLVTHLKNVRGQRVYIVSYRARILEESKKHQVHNWINSAKWGISNSLIKSEDVLAVDGGIRDYDTIEFWIAPKASPPPALTPRYSREEAIDCPSIYVFQDGIEFDRSKPISFAASIRMIGDYGYEWSVSDDGKIIGDVGKASLEVDVSDIRGDLVTAFLRVSGVPVPCKHSFIAVATIGRTPRLVDEFGMIANGDFKARHDAFNIVLHRHPGTRGVVHFYGGRSHGLVDVNRNRSRFILNQKFRGFDSSRFELIDAGFKEEQSTEFWLVPEGVESPKPTPSVDKQFIRAPNTRRSRRS